MPTRQKPTAVENILGVLALLFLVLVAFNIKWRVLIADLSGRGNESTSAPSQSSAPPKEKSWLAAPSKSSAAPVAKSPASPTAESLASLSPEEQNELAKQLVRELESMPPDKRDKTIKALLHNKKFFEPAWREWWRGKIEDEMWRSAGARAELQKIFLKVHPWGTVTGTKLHDVSCHWKTASELRQDDDLLDFTVRWSVYWEGMGKDDGFTKFDVTWDCEAKRMASVKVVSTNGKTNDDLLLDTLKAAFWVFGQVAEQSR